MQDLRALQEMLQNEEQRELLAQREALAGEMGLEDRTILGPCRRSPRPKDGKKALEMPPGDYAVAGYAETTYRNAPRTILFAIPLDENGQPTTPVDTPIWGPFLQEELAKIAPLATLVGKQLYCRLGREKTTKSKHKCRIAQLFVLQDPDTPQQQDAPDAFAPLEATVATALPLPLL